MRQHIESWFGAGHTVYEVGCYHCGGYYVLSPFLAESLGWCLDPSRKSLSMCSLNLGTCTGWGSALECHTSSFSQEGRTRLVLPVHTPYSLPCCPTIIGLFVAQEASLCLFSTPRPSWPQVGVFPPSGALLPLLKAGGPSCPRCPTHCSVVSCTRSSAGPVQAAPVISGPAHSKRISWSSGNDC